MKMLDEVRGFCKNPLSAEGHDSEYLMFANVAFRALTTWFGRPFDEDTPYEIVMYHRSVQSYDFLRRRYTLFIRRDDEIEPMLGSIVHEMYHRVTSRSKRAGLHRAIWINEILACSASRRLLEASGHHDYVEALVMQAKSAPRRLTVYQLARVRSWPAFAMLRPYPPYFAETVIVVGESLEEAVGWANMCAMVHCQTWSEWLALLSPNECKRVRAMFGDFPPLMQG